MQPLRSICLAIFLALPAGTMAQEQSSQPIQVNVGDVTDNRTTTFNPGCTVQLKLTGDAAADAQSVRRVILAEAADTTGSLGP